MDVATKKYTLPELKVGMQVRKSQLSEIVDVYIVLTDVKSVNNDLDGKIGFIGKEITEEMTKLRNPQIPITCIYNNSTEIGDDVTYDE